MCGVVVGGGEGEACTGIDIDTYTQVKQGCWGGEKEEGERVCVCVSERGKEEKKGRK